MTFANPMAIIPFLALFASFGIRTGTANYLEPIALVLGIGLGSFIWWVLLTGFVVFILRNRLSDRLTKLINQVSGAIVAVFGGVAVVTAHFL